MKLFKISFLSFAVTFGAWAQFPSKGFYDKKNPHFYLGHFDTLAEIRGCQNFSGLLARGGQPLIQKGSGWAEFLRSQGVTYILDLRSEARLTAEELAVSQGFGYILLPLKTSGQTQPQNFTIKIRHPGQNTERRTLPSTDATLEILRLVDQLVSKGHKIYIHCQRGEDRSGTFVALLRRCDLWRSEFRRYGGTLYPSLKDLFQKVQPQFR